MKPEKNLGRGSWDVVIQPRNGFFDIKLSELLHYRDLAALFAKRDIATVYKQTILGPLWFVVQPLMTTMIYVFVFGNLAKLSTDGIPQVLFYFGGTMLWQVFQVNLLQISDTFIHNAHLFGKVYFPRLCIPLSKLFSNGLAFVIQAVVLFAFSFWYVATGAIGMPSPWIVLVLPVAFLWLFALSFGIGTIVSALTTKYRDLRQLLQFGMHLWMYATPVVYPISQVQGKLRWLMYLNPVSAPIELFRVFAYGVGDRSTELWAISAIMTVVALLFGIALFSRIESTFVDVI